MKSSHYCSPQAVVGMSPKYCREAHGTYAHMHYARVKQQSDAVYLRLPEQTDQGMLLLIIAIIFSSCLFMAKNGFFSPIQ